MTVLAQDLKSGDVIALTLARRVEVTVAEVVPTGGKKWMTDVPVLRITFTDAPRVIKGVEVAADQVVDFVFRPGEPAVDSGYCPGCGQHFKGERGLRAHQAAKFVTLACRPARKA